MHLRFPACIELALETMQAHALAGDRTAVEVQGQRQVQRRILRKVCQAIQGKEGFLRRTDQDAAGAVLRHEGAMPLSPFGALRTTKRKRAGSMRLSRMRSTSPSADTTGSSVTS